MPQQAPVLSFSESVLPVQRVVQNVAQRRHVQMHLVQAVSAPPPLPKQTRPVVYPLRGFKMKLDALRHAIYEAQLTDNQLEQVIAYHALFDSNLESTKAHSCFFAFCEMCSGNGCPQGCSTSNCARGCSADSCSISCAQGTSVL